MVVLIKGVAGSGKMAAGLALDDTDRAPWLAAIRAHLEAVIARGESAVVTCSALKMRYRAAVGADLAGVKLVHLHGAPALILERLRARPGTS